MADGRSAQALRWPHPAICDDPFAGSLVDTDGECVYSLQFDQDPLLKVAYVELSIDVELPLACQRSLQRFLYPVQIRQRLGLIRDEADEAALPAEYEALLVPEDGMLRAVDMIEDELVLSTGGAGGAG